MPNASTIPRNHTSGRWAVVLDGVSQWRCSMALGDGVTRSSLALVTRCRTKAEAEDVAGKIRYIQPGLMPGKGSAFSVSVLRYRRSDYVSYQDQRNPRAYQPMHIAVGLTPADGMPTTRLRGAD